MDDSSGFAIDRSAFSKRSGGEIVAETIKLIRGLWLRRRLDHCGKYLRSGGNIRIVKKNASIILGRKVQLYSGIKLSAWGSEGAAEISIGDNTAIGDRTEIHAGQLVSIGKGCNISWDVVIMDRDYHKLGGDKEEIRPVVIHDNVWIGCRAVVLKAVTIGKGAVVAAGSVVTADVPAGTLAAGNPARVVRTGIQWSP